MNLSQVSQTAILALICRAIESGKENPVFYDPMAVLCWGCSNPSCDELRCSQGARDQVALCRAKSQLTSLSSTALT
jgi:O-methyltransferase involved in polyketide biosynthesis